MATNMQSFFGGSADKLEDKIMQLGGGLPRLDNDLKMMQLEMQHLVQNFGELQKKQAGAANREYKYE